MVEAYLPMFVMIAVASIFRELGWFGLFEMTAFITILALTLIYAWKKGALEWEK